MKKEVVVLKTNFFVCDYKFLLPSGNPKYAGALSWIFFGSK